MSDKSNDCQCTTTSGKRCTRERKSGSKFCWQHQNCKVISPTKSASKSASKKPTKKSVTKKSVSKKSTPKKSETKTAKPSKKTEPKTTRAKHVKHTKSVKSSIKIMTKKSPKPLPKVPVSRHLTYGEDEYEKSRKQLMARLKYGDESGKLSYDKYDARLLSPVHKRGAIVVRRDDDEDDYEKSRKALAKMGKISHSKYDTRSLLSPTLSKGKYVRQKARYVESLSSDEESEESSEEEPKPKKQGWVSYLTGGLL